MEEGVEVVSSVGPVERCRGDATSGATFTRTVQPSPEQDSNCLVPVEDCKGCPALAGARNVGLDDPRAGRPDSHCNFGDRRIRGVSCGCSTQRKSLKRGVPSKRFGTHAVTRAHCSPPPTGPVSAAAQAPPIDRLTIKSRSRRRQVFPACAHRLPQQPWWLPPSLEDDGWAGRRTTS